MINLLYQDLVFQQIKFRDKCRNPYHHDGSYAVMVTLACGHWKWYNRHNVPKFEAKCDVCTMERARNAKGESIMKYVGLRRVK